MWRTNEFVSVVCKNSECVTAIITCRYVCSRHSGLLGLDASSGVVDFDFAAFDYGAIKMLSGAVAMRERVGA